MASNPPGACCIVGVKHEGTPTGSIIKIGNRDAYLAVPEESKAQAGAAVLYLADIFGIWQNSKLVADQYAANGYLCVIPDLFNGDQLTTEAMGAPGFDIMKWLGEGSDGKNPHTPEAVDPIVVEAINWLKSEKGVTKIASAGYCFGAKPLARHVKDGINVGFFAHPSFVSEDELKAFNVPLSIAAAEIDNIFTTELRHKSEIILKEKGDPYQINLYSEVEHGFAVRAELSSKQARFAKEQAFIQAVTWFNTWL
ncbi:putative cytoplasm protein [Microdochium trichocladiopsis]|uniref:Cytoplasm protein n=1 Tax=Microdochium trichocladiopsis TaxID=1682393 RepID=A0A9P9BS43_9PEZI|nr:putative cytoplasm protein [Microdochium trichocladiopsis]KAH7027940.1 putative cytoplasm protein [Microdochium trichocladiopsis]